MGNFTEKQRIGRLGEEIAVKYLKNKGFLIITQNYLKKCGEIDIIAQKGKILHFVEVKTVSELANSRLGRSEKISAVSAVRQGNVSLRLRVCGQAVKPVGSELASSETDNYRPEDNIHQNKLKRLGRTIQIYLAENDPKGDCEWFFDIITVVIDEKNRKAKIRFLGDIML